MSAPRSGDVTRMTRYRGGTYSHTVDTIVFTDGIVGAHRPDPAQPQHRGLLAGLHRSSRRPAVALPGGDLVGGAEPARPRPRGRGRLDSAAIRFPSLGTAELSRRLRAAGYPLGAANISDHEAIAATQAAIWHFTNGLELDNRPLNVPSRCDVPKTGSSSSSTVNPN